MKTLYLVGFLVTAAACGGVVNGLDQGSGSGSGSSSSGGSGSGSGSSSGAAALCTQTGGSVVQTYCSAQPDFAVYTCTSANGSPDNGVGHCLPAGDGEPSAPECVCPGGEGACFDPVQGCIPVPDGSGSGTSWGSSEGSSWGSGTSWGSSEGSSWGSGTGSSWGSGTGWGSSEGSSWGSGTGGGCWGDPPYCVGGCGEVPSFCDDSGNWACPPTPPCEDAGAADAAITLPP
jgi:hypothetical protein